MVIDQSSYNKAAHYGLNHGYEVRPAAPSSIVLHSTNNRRRTAFASECKFLFETPDVSAHYLVSKTGIVVEFLDPLRFMAWHAGPALTPYLNSRSIGVELHISQGETPTATQIEAAGALCQILRARFTIPVSRIDTHRAVALPRGRKSDPEGWTDEAFYAWRATLGRPRYRFRVTQVALSSNDLRAALLAPTVDAPHIYQAGDVITVDDVTGGMAHDASGLGFVPVAVLEKL